MKRILRALYTNPSADLSGFKDAHVADALDVLSKRLIEELGKTYRWLASCTVAVEAGRWGGERRRKRRVKLLNMISTCRTRLGLDPLDMGDPQWASVGLYYGYGACSAYAQDHGMSPLQPTLIGLLDSHGAEVALHVQTFLSEVGADHV